MHIVTCLFNLYAEYIMQNARLDEAQAGIKIVRGNINNLIYADDTTLMAESEEELKSLLIKVKEERERLSGWVVAATVARPGTRAEESSSECRAKTKLKSFPREWHRPS